MAFDFGRNLLNRISSPRKTRKQEQPQDSNRAIAGLKFDAGLEEESRALLRQAGCLELALAVRVCWNLRMRTTAGTACWRTRRVTLNPKLVEISAEEVSKTLRHELAHLVAQDRAGRRRIAPHGREWKQACADLGIAGEARCHTLPFQARRIKRKFRYRCPACANELARVRKAKGRIACLRCCRKHNRGKYSERFRFVAVASEEG